MKTIRLFGLCLAFAAMLTFGALVGTAAATGDIHTDIAGHTYAVNFSGADYTLSFVQGPFGPGPAGKATLLEGATVVGIYDFHVQGNLIIIDNLTNFYYTDFQLIWVPISPLLVFTCGDCTD